MRDRLGTATGRGLLAARLGDRIALVSALAYLLFGRLEWILVVGLFVAGAPALVSARRLWVGRFEFGPDHARAARRGAYAFAGASLLFVLALLSFQTFPSASLGLDLTDGNETGDPSRIHRFRDLVPPLLMVSAAIVIEGASGALLLWNLVGVTWKKWVSGNAGLGGATGVLVAWVGWPAIDRFEAQTGAFVDSQPAADFYYNGFLDIVVGMAAVGFALTRVVVLILLERAIRKVAEAERDAETAAPTTGPAPSP